MNLFSELDVPSEYWIDVVNEQLYFMPPGGNPGAAEAFLSFGSYGIAGVGAASLRPGPSMQVLDDNGPGSSRRAFAPPVVIPSDSPTVSYVSFMNFDVMFARDTGIAIPSASSVSIINIDASNHGQTGMVLYGSNNQVIGSTVMNTGCTAVSVGGGDLSSLQPGNNSVRNSIMSQYARIVRTYNPGKLSSYHHFCFSMN